jgi:hypothetical protein
MTKTFLIEKLMAKTFLIEKLMTKTFLIEKLMAKTFLSEKFLFENFCPKRRFIESAPGRRSPRACLVRCRRHRRQNGLRGANVVKTSEPNFSVG